jgi:hypothetical protein
MDKADLLKKFMKLTRGKKVKINDETYTFIEAEFSSPDYHPQFIFFKYQEIPKVCIPYSYCVEFRNKEIFFFKLTEDKIRILEIKDMQI